MGCVDFSAATRGASERVARKRVLSMVCRERSGRGLVYQIPWGEMRKEGKSGE